MSDIIRVKMKAKTHEDTRVISAQFKLNIKKESDMSRLLDALTGAMKSVNKWAAENDVIVGHIKSSVSWGEEAIMVSTTGQDVQVKGSRPLCDAPCSVDVGIAVIIFGINLIDAQYRVEELAMDVLLSLGHSISITYMDLSEHEDECGGHDHNHEHYHTHSDDCDEDCNCGLDCDSCGANFESCGH